MARIGGAASGAPGGTITYTVRARLDTSEVDAAVSQSEKELASQEKKWSWMTTSQVKQAEAMRRKTEFGIKMTLRLMYAEIMQTFNLVSSVAGWSKNMTYQVVANTISGVVGLIATANLAASTLGPIPGVGPWLAALSVGNAVSGMILSLTLSASQASMQAHDDYIGNLLDGVDF